MLQMFFFLPFRVMRVYSTHTKKKAFCISKMSSGPLADGEVSRNFALLDDTLGCFIFFKST